MKKIGIIIVDDHSLMRIGLTSSIQAEPDMEVLAEAGTGEQALDLFRTHKPDIVLMDLRLPGWSGEETTRRICQEFPKARVIVLSTFEEHESIFRCIQGGAQSYLPKSVPLQELLHAIRTVAAGQSYLPASISARLVERMQTPELSAREREVLELIVKGRTNKQIASELYISETTVKDHVSRIFIKLHATDRTQASTVAIQRGIVQLP